MGVCIISNHHRKKKSDAKILVWEEVASWSDVGNSGKTLTYTVEEDCIIKGVAQITPKNGNFKSASSSITCTGGTLIAKISDTTTLRDHHYSCKQGDSISVYIGTSYTAGEDWDWPVDNIWIYKGILA